MRNEDLDRRRLTDSRHLSSSARYLSRRDILRTVGGGFGSLALASLFANETSAETHHRAKARRVIQIFCSGGMSQVDTFDYKPELIRLH